LVCDNITIVHKIVLAVFKYVTKILMYQGMLQLWLQKLASLAEWSGCGVTLIFW